MTLFRAYLWDRSGTEEREEVIPAQSLADAAVQSDEKARELGLEWACVRVEEETYEAEWLHRVHVFGV